MVGVHPQGPGPQPHPQHLHPSRWSTLLCGCERDSMCNKYCTILDLHCKCSVCLLISSQLLILQHMWISIISKDKEVKQYLPAKKNTCLHVEAEKKTRGGARIWLQHRRDQPRTCVLQPGFMGIVSLQEIQAGSKCFPIQGSTVYAACGRWTQVHFYM